MRMKLSAKGRQAPPPALNSLLQPLSEKIQTWPGIVAATHWHLSRNGQVDGADFYRGSAEMGHIHLDGDLHLALSPMLAHALITAKFARRFPFAGCDEWVLYRIRSVTDVSHAEHLMRLAYDYLSGASEAKLLEGLAERLRRVEADAPSTQWS